MLVMGTPPSVSTTIVQRSPVATSATPSTPALSLHAGGDSSSTDTTLAATVGCVYFADTFLLNGW